MKILFLHTSEATDKDYYEALKACTGDVAEYEAPKNVFDKDEPYIMGLLKVIEESGADVCFSLGYYPIVSIACKAMGRKYAACCVHAYNKGMFSFTLLNDCNRVFVPDYTVYKKFRSEGFNNVFYLPLAVLARNIADNVNEADSADGPDVCMMQDIKPRGYVEGTPFSADCPLMDATRGYLDGCVDCRSQIRNLPPMADYLPPYVKDEMSAKMPALIDADSVETPESYYENVFFNEAVTSGERQMYFNATVSNKAVKKAALYSSVKVEVPQIAEYHSAIERGEALARLARGNKINLYVPHRNWQSGVPQRLWDIMAAGGFVLMPGMGELPGLFEDSMPNAYYHLKDAYKKVEYFIDRPSERVASVNAILDVIRKKHTLEKRIEELLEIL